MKLITHLRTAIINKPDYDKTKINYLISTLLASDGTYIGVTATPARLNLNNTFQNESEMWVDFAPHPEYVGQEFFFPDDEKFQYYLHTFSADVGDEKAEIRNAILHFCVAWLICTSLAKKKTLQCSFILAESATNMLRMLS